MLLWVNAALLKYEVTLDDLYSRYGSGQLAGEVWVRLPMSFRSEPAALRVIR